MTEPDDQAATEIGATLLLERFLPYRLSVLSNTVSKAIARLYADRFGITIPEWRVMAVLGRFGPSSAAEICKATAMDKVQVSRALQRLTEDSLVSRRTDKTDRRRSVVAMTTKGRGVYDEIVPLALSREEILLEGLSTDEKHQLDLLLAKLATRAATLDGD
ncbi:MAG: MarR family winged helix-turn-helix transcriptional regulator [Alphaproteobacteria bacterium]|nr:MarR family winged helix-turn-helix transcriptional regulator [Alphaproteobacteria bacterium]